MRTTEEIRAAIEELESYEPRATETNGKEWEAQLRCLRGVPQPQELSVGEQRAIYWTRVWLNGESVTRPSKFWRPVMFPRTPREVVNQLVWELARDEGHDVRQLDFVALREQDKRARRFLDLAERLYEVATGKRPKY